MPSSTALRKIESVQPLWQPAISPHSWKLHTVNQEADFQPEQVIGLLGRYEVKYVVVGGLAAVSQGAPLITQDIDICYERSAENLERLASALREVNATLRGAKPGLPFRLDAASLGRGDTFTFATDLGWIDIIGTPAGTQGYRDLAATADSLLLFGHHVQIAGVLDLIRMKRAAGRPKDLLALEELGALRDVLAERGQAKGR